MANKVIQVRYYSDNDKTNTYPGDVNRFRLITGEAFDSYTPILQLGIQTIPGTKFYINKKVTEPIYVGQSGVYEIDFNNKTSIGSLSFDLESIELIHQNPGGYLIVDIIYEEAD